MIVAFTLTALLSISNSLQAPSAMSDVQQLVSSISPRSLNGHLNFIASDLLEGRKTPSPGLDLAATYIASHFQRCGLEPIGDDYFQTASLTKEGVAYKVRNVVGVLRGSDPKLKDTYVLVTAHYDHLGKKKSGEGDLIYNGANDDGSGTVSVLELAEAFSRLKTPPKRSIVFMTFYGEELGLVGSNYYGNHPIYPVSKTVADINIEQVGRTDDTEGARVLSAAMTGYDYTDLGEIFSAAGKPFGITVTKHTPYSDMFFALSDNQAMADRGVPSCTLCTAFEFPDYHKVSDSADKVDYMNLSKVLQMVAAGVYTVANSEKAPSWTSNPKAKKYKDIREKQGG